MGGWKALVALLMVTVHVVTGGPIFEDFDVEGRNLVSKATDPGYRLPNNINTQEYDITLTPYLNTNDAKKFTFDGVVSIKFTVKNDTRQVVIHARSLTIKRVSISPSSPIITQAGNETYNFLYLNLDRQLNVGTVYTLYFEYSGKMEDDMHGFYRSSYVEGNQTKWMATTQFQPVHARRAFPCFDEPEYKAIFKLTINCPTGLNCYSNMRSKKSDNNVYTFEPTPPMSTYLLAFIVSEFVKVESNADFAILARPEAADLGKFSFNAGQKLLERMENYTMIEYYTVHPNATLYRMKMDQAAIPDFSAGAMENWGLLTYREASLMVDENHTSTINKQRVVTVLAHEIAHMWFGDVVTCHWWSNTWLNEGFARFFQYYITDEVYPGYHLDDQFITAQLHTAMTADTSLDSSPLTNNNVNSPAEVGDAFGSITYNKGASIIRMMEHWLGKSTMRNGLHRHVATKMYEVVTPEHLFTQLQNAANSSGSIQNYTMSVKDVFESWTSKSGYPVVTVSMGSDNRVQIKQERFVKDGETPNNDLYMIPITYATKSKPNFDDTKPAYIMNNASRRLSDDSKKEWVILNVQQSGYYRVQYSDELLDLIIAQLQTSSFNTIHEYNRAQLVDDAFNLAREGRMNYSRVFDVIQFLEKDKSYTPWSAAYAGINFLRPRFVHLKNLTEDVDMHISKLMKVVVDDLGFDTDGDELRKIFRTTTMNLACSMAHESCVNKSRELFGAWAGNNTHIPADHREFVYCNGLRYGTASDYDKLWAKYLGENLVNEKVVIMGAMGCTNVQAKVLEYLKHTIDTNTTIRDQDRMTAFNSALTGNVENVITVWDFIKNNTSAIRHVYGSDNLRTMMSSIAMRMDNEQLGWVKIFVNGNNTLTDDEKTSTLRSVESAEKSIKWVESKEDEIRSWIYKKYNSGTSFGASLALIVTLVIGVLYNN